MKKQLNFVKSRLDSNSNRISDGMEQAIYEKYWISIFKECLQKNAEDSFPAPKDSAPVIQSLLTRPTNDQQRTHLIRCFMTVDCSPNCLSFQ